MDNVIHHHHHHHPIVVVVVAVVATTTIITATTTMRRRRRRRRLGAPMNTMNKFKVIFSINWYNFGNALLLHWVLLLREMMMMTMMMIMIREDWSTIHNHYKENGNKNNDNDPGWIIHQNNP
jgi:hypothetical protein